MATDGLNRLEPRYYRIQITGAVDNVSPEQFARANGDPAQDYQDEMPTTRSASLDIERSNMRYEAVIRGLSTTIQPLFAVSHATSSRTKDVDASDIAFTVAYDRPEFLVTEDEDNPGTFLGYEQSGSDALEALERFVARELIVDIVQKRQIFDPESYVTGESKGPAIEVVTAVKPFANLTAANAAITVTEISNLADN